MTPRDRHVLLVLRASGATLGLSLACAGAGEGPTAGAPRAKTAEAPTRPPEEATPLPPPTSATTPIVDPTGAPEVAIIPAPPSDPEVPGAPQAPTHELDRTSWRCGDLTTWSFWGDHMLEIDKDAVAVAMGAFPVVSRTDYAVDHRGRAFTLAATRFEDVRLGRPPEPVDGPTYRFRYRLRGDRLTVTGPSLEAPLECVRRCYDLDFVRVMDARYGTATDPPPPCGSEGKHG